ncbi:response regulator transcription factor [Parapedobacter koreensis]|uniref:Two-component system, OmpR family, copper resistance phosphate regulon response regulator CusR n=1 Tax=Parapedobacter koreensis TaxID=332977 RepID=A0A1H7F2W5_9SPHI|nr:response regulator transcription factor [Parapedobacter koreensis]SEK19707.1 two-component system, OmpR family, copper resistance phosphate regulon response regulator CusR [Parapedobacter koreensis]
MRNKILLIEDDWGLATTLRDFFEDNGLEVRHAATGDEGLSLYREQSPDLIVLDIVLPRKNGFEVISEIRDTDLKIPIVLMTGTEVSPESQIKGYRLGAINYMQKPILPQALLSLIQNILSLPIDLKQFHLEGHRIRIHSQAVDIDAETYTLRDKDAILLELLLRRKNQIVARSTLLKQIWYDDHPDRNNLLDGAILRIRRVLSSYPTLQIKTVYGEGYILEAKNK